MPRNEYNTIATGSPKPCPTSCDSWFFAYRVKSGIFNDSVAQYPTMAVSDGQKKCRNPDVVVNLLGAASIGPNPPALRTMKISSIDERINMTGTE